jgi:hypothetical protein
MVKTNSDLQKSDSSDIRSLRLFLFRVLHRRSDQNLKRGKIMIKDINLEIVEQQQQFENIMRRRKNEGKAQGLISPTFYAQLLRT